MSALVSAAFLHPQLEVDVDIFAGLGKIRLAGLPHGIIPDGPMASALATKARALSKKGVLRPEELRFITMSWPE